MAFFLANWIGMEQPLLLHLRLSQLWIKLFWKNTKAYIALNQGGR